MKKITIFLTLICITFYSKKSFCDENLSNYMLSFNSYELSTLNNGLIALNCKITFFDTVSAGGATLYDLRMSGLTIDTTRIDIFNIQNVNTNFLKQSGYYVPGDTAQIPVLISFDTTKIPYSAIKIFFVLYYNGSKYSLPINIYFTPYNTIEVWNSNDFEMLPRRWMFSNNATRSFVSKSQIPVTDLTQAEIADDSIHKSWYSVDGLAYSIPVHAQIDTFDLEPVSSDTLGEVKADGCGNNHRRWKGWWQGNVKALVNKDNQTTTNMNIAGIKVEVWDRDNFPNFDDKLGTGYTDENGNFSIYVETCQRYQGSVNAYNEGNSLEIYYTVVGVNQDETIKLRKRDSENRKVDIYKDNYYIWNYNNGDDLNVYRDITFSDDEAKELKPQLLHWAIQARDFINSTHGGTGFSLPGNNDPLVIKIHPWDQESSCFIPGGFVSPTILSINTLFPGVITIAASLWGATHLSNHDCAYIGEDADEYDEDIIWHELGHYLMWHLQSEAWINDIEATFAHHHYRYNCKMPGLSWAEGWANAFGAIVDAVYFSNDNECTFDSFYNFEKRGNCPGGPDNPTSCSYLENNDYPVKQTDGSVVNEKVLTHGFLSEFNIAAFIYDLWDNINYIPNFQENGDKDKISISFAEITRPIRENPGNLFASSAVISNIYEYIRDLRENYNCQTRKYISDITKLNSLGKLEDNTPNPNVPNVSLDEIELTMEGSFKKFKKVKNLPYDYEELDPYEYEYVFDNNKISTIINSYNAAVSNSMNGEFCLIDDLTIDNTGNFLINGNVKKGFFNFIDNYNSPPLPLSIINVENYADIISIKSESKLLLGDINGNKSKFNIKENSILKIDDGGSLILRNSEIIVNAGGTLLLKSNSNTTLYGGCKIIIEAGGYLCVEQNALLSLLNSHIELQTGANIGVYPNAPFFENTLCQQPWEINYTGNGSIIYDCISFIQHTNLNYAPNGDYVVNSNENWVNTNYVMKSNLIVNSGQELMIQNSTIKFQEGKKLIVMPGGKLYVHHSTLTNFQPCKKLWGGVEVRGNSNLAQSFINQGSVSMDNESIVENAEIGINAPNVIWPGGADELSGGIVVARNSHFKNNITGISFGKYQNFDPGNPSVMKNNISYFSGCSFITDEGMNDFATNPMSFITMNAVSGIRIMNCDFINNSTLINEIPVTSRGKGISGIDAGFIIDGECLMPSGECENEDLEKTVFKNLEYGIKCIYTNPARFVSIQNTDFLFNHRGILLSGVNAPIIKGNSFDIGAVFINPIIERSYGLYLENVSGFQNELNIFESSNLGYLGAIIKNSSSATNALNYNSFSKLFIGSQFQGTNSGLLVLCNKYVNGKTIDIAITSGSIATKQGECLGLLSDYNAGNTFSNTCLMTQSDIYTRSTTPHIDYYYGSTYANEQPICYNGSTVNPDYCSSTSTDCTIPVGNQSQLSSQITLKTVKIDSLRSKIDGGNTTALVNYVNTHNAGQVKTAVLAVSPYASDAVLLAAVNKSNPLPPGTLKEIIIPNSPVTSNVMNAINQKSLPVGIKRQIVAAQTGTSARSVLEANINALSTSRDLEANQLISLILKDTTITTQDSLINVLTRLSGEAYKKDLATLYLGIDNCNEAFNALTQIVPGTEENNDYIALNTILANLCSANQTIFDITPAQELTIRTIASHDTKVSANAKAILTSVYGETFEEIVEEIEIPDSLTLSGTLYGGAACGGDPVEGYTLMLTDEYNNPVTTVRPVTTGADGTFRFDYFEMLQLDTAQLFGIATEGGFRIGTLGYKTIGQWIDGGPWTLTLENISEVWVATMSHNDSLDDAATALDLQGSVFVTGSGRSQAYGYDIVTIKYNAIGKEQWLADYNNHDTLSYDDYAVALDVNSQGQAYVTGYGMDAEGAYDYLTLKYDTAGTLLWSQRYTGGFEDKAVSVVADNTSKSGALVTGSSQDSHDVFGIVTIKYNPDGSVYWQKQYSDPDRFRMTPVKALTDATGNFYIAATTYAGKPFFSLLKYDANGSLVWKKDYKYSDSDVLTGITLDASGQIILCGTSTNAGVNEATTAAYNSSGTLMWEKHLALSGGVSTNAYDVAADQSWNIFLVCGSSIGIKTVCFNTTGGVNWMTDEAYSMGETVEKLKVYPAKDKKCVVAAHALVPVGGGQIVKNTRLIMYKDDGTELWKKVSDQWSGISSVAASVNDNVYLAGSTKFYENGIPKNSMTTAKYSQCPSTASLLKPSGNTETIAQNNESLLFGLFPNPAKDEVNIKINKPLASDADVCIYNFQGSLIQCLHLSRGTSQYLISTKELSNGIYLVQINATGGVPENKKLIILK